MIHATPEPRTAARRLADLEANSILPRVWSGDHTVWGSGPEEIANRLAWLRAPETMRASLRDVREFAREALADGVDSVALLGMGGSSLAPETLARIARPAGKPQLVVLDTTHPATVARAMRRLDPRRTLFVVSTKSGTTPETMSLFRLFHRRAEEALGRAAGSRFVAISDPGSPLVGCAAERGFRRTFLNDPGFGGRYSALSLVGLVPAALLGLDLDGLLDSGAAMAARCAATVPVDRNPAALLAALLVAHADEGRDKVTFVLPQAAQSFGDWAEQLIAESTGKRGRGLVPIVGEPLGTPSAYGSDRLFLRFDERSATPEPAVSCPPISAADLGGQFFLWEMATALAGHLLGVNPFDQPDVEAAKRATRDLLAAARSQGELPVGAPPRLEADDLRTLVADARPGDYVGLLAYLDPLPELIERLNELRVALRDQTRCATTLGLGPRFLHSTGQLHKGDGGNGLFLVLVDEPRVDLDIPEDGERSVRLGLLLRAQALGDARALTDRQRRVRVRTLGPDATDHLARVVRA